MIHRSASSPPSRQLGTRRIVWSWPAGKKGSPTHSRPPMDTSSGTAHTMLRDDHRGLASTHLGGPGELAEAEPGFDDGVGVEGHGVDALLEQPFGQIWVVAGTLAADTDVFASGLAGFDRSADHEFDRGVAFVEASGDQGGIAVQPESELSHV